MRGHSPLYIMNSCYIGLIIRNQFMPYLCNISIDNCELISQSINFIDLDDIAFIKYNQNIENLNIG